MIGTNMEPILIVTGAATAIALIQFITPSQVLRMVFGEAPTNVVCLALARHWGLLVFCVGVLLIYAAFHPSVRHGSRRDREDCPWCRRAEHVLARAPLCSRNCRGRYPHCNRLYHQPGGGIDWLFDSYH
jgi:hypothetical protein